MDAEIARRVAKKLAGTPVRPPPVSPAGASLATAAAVAAAAAAAASLRGGRECLGDVYIAI